jgi:hypothetical protein
VQAHSGRLLFEADGDDIAEGQIDEFNRWALMCERLIFDVPGVRPVCLSTSQGTGCARARAIAALSSERSVSPTVIVIGLALLVHSHRRAAQRKVKLLSLPEVPTVYPFMPENRRIAANIAKLPGY